jgi:methyl-accepting chemotaxis protein
VQDAGTAMQEIVSGVQRFTDIIGEISAATSEQAKGIDTVNQSVNHLDQMTQQNAALVEESAASAGSLKDQAARLAQAVAVFRIERGSSFGGSSEAKPVAAAPKPAVVVKPVAHAPAPAPTPAPSPIARPAPVVAAAPVAKPAPALATAAAASKAPSDDWETF